MHHLDGDDYWYPEHLAELQGCITTTSEDHVLWWNAGDVTIKFTTTRGNTFESAKNFNYHPHHPTWNPKYHGLHFRLDAIIFPSSVAVRRSRFEEVGGFLEEVWLGEDQLLWYHLCGDALKKWFLMLWKPHLQSLAHLSNKHGDPVSLKQKATWLRLRNFIPLWATKVVPWKLSHKPTISLAK